MLNWEGGGGGHIFFEDDLVLFTFQSQLENDIRTGFTAGVN